MRVPIPMHLASKISNDAVKNARAEMKGYGWSDKTLQSIAPMASDGTVGIRALPKYQDKDGKPSLMFQERGTKPFLMWWVNGKTLPMGCKQGDGPHFRRGGHVGEPGYVDIPHVGKVWRQQRWRHPGLKPRSFMRNGLEKAIQDNQPLIKSWAAGILKGHK